MKLNVAPALRWFSSIFTLVSLLLFALAMFNSMPAHGQAKMSRQVTQAIDESQLTTLEGHVRLAANANNDRGSVEDDFELGPIMLLLSRTTEQQHELDSVVDQLHNVHSKSYHQWLTPAEFGQRFSPADEDVAAVANWLRSKGLRVVEIPPSKTHITFTGTAGQLRDAFHVEIHRLSVNGEAHMAAMNEPQVPAALAPVIAGLHKLDDFNPKPQHKDVGTFTKDPETGRFKRIGKAGVAAIPDYSSGQSNLIGPQDFYTIYNENPLLTAGITGAGQTIAVIEQTAINASDVTTFRAEFGLPTYPATPNATLGGVNYILGTASGVGGDTACSAPETPSSGNEDESEADIDVEWAGAVAPKAIVDFVACGNSSQFGSGIDTAAQHVMNYLSSTVSAFSLSYGGCESEMIPMQFTFYSNLWEQAAAQGMTAIVSAGDNGTTACDQGSYPLQNNPSVNGLASTAWNVAAGGTDFGDAYETASYTTGPASTWWGTNTVDDGSALSYIPEIAWGSYCANSLVSSYYDFIGNTQYGTTPEALCNNGTLLSEGWLQAAGGSGGVSTVTPAPGWQNVYGAGLYSGSTEWRTLPDVSFFAAWGPWGHALTYCTSDEFSCSLSSTNVVGAGGTSFVAPQLAGLMALVNQKTGARQGQADYTLYNLAAQEYGTPGSPNTANLTNCSGSAKGAGVGASCIFHDIAADTPSLQGGLIASNNVQACPPSYISDCFITTNADLYGLTTIPGPPSSTLAYYAGAGYDLTTGLGSVNIYNLVQNWTSIGAGFVTTTTLSSSAPSILATGSATLTATVTASGRGDSKTPTGTVKFYLGSTSGTLLGQGTLSGGCTGSICSAAASLVVAGSRLSSGPNTIFGVYGGDATEDVPSTSAPFTEEIALPASHFALTTSATVGEGAPFIVTVTALDTNGFTAAGYNGTVSFKSSDTKFVNPGPLTLAGGVANTTVTLKTLGTQTITATDTTTSTLTGSGSFSVGPGPAASLTISVPATALSGTWVNVTVTALDAYGVTATGYTGTVAISSSDPLANLDPPSMLTNGWGTFVVDFGTLGSQTVTATDESNSSFTVTSKSITVVAPNLVVTTAGDDPDGNYSNCSPQDAPGIGNDPDCSLRDALSYAGYPPAIPANITFSSTVFNASKTAAQNTITLTNGALTVSPNVSITGATTGSGATITNLVTVNGGNKSTVFTVGGGATGVSLNSLNITGGTTTGHGGGISNAGTLTVNNSTISGNSASSTTSGVATAGGGIYNTGTLTVNNSTISGNSIGAVGATATGGGIYNSFNASLYNTTVTNNTITSGGNGLGGGIYTTGSASNFLLLLNSTVTGNTADSQGGGVYSTQEVVLANAIVLGNSPNGSDVVNNGGTEVDSGGNFIGVNGVNLAPLGNYGGPTQTLLPLPGSIAICGGAAANANGLTTDQRGLSRTTTYGSTGCVDSGAVQTNYALAFSTEPPSSVVVNAAISPAPVVGLTESGIATVAAANSVSMTDTASLLSGTTTAALSSGSATFSNLVIPSNTSNDKLNANLALTTSLNLTAQSSAFQVAAAAPVVSLSATSQSFGSVNIGAFGGSQSVTLTNAGSAALSITSITVTGTNASSFVFANSCGSSLAAGANCSIHGHFAPLASGALTAAITITDNAGNSPQSISLNGTGVAVPVVKLSATSLSFGSENVGATTASQTVTLTNTGSAALSIGSISVTGTNASSFVFANTCATSLAVGANCTIHGHFGPLASGALAAAITITDNAAGSPQSIALSGTGVAVAAVKLTATSLSFGNENVGSTTASQTVTLTNTGSAALSITSISVTGANASSFTFANSCGTSMAAGANCTIHGHFGPLASGALTAAISIADNATGSPQSIALSGTGIAAPIVSLTATKLSFGTVKVGETSGSQSVTLTNTGDATLTISGISLTGPNVSSFVFANSCGTTLAPGANCTIHGHFAPISTGALAASVIISDNASGSPQSITLSGTGQ